jgi:Kef-type K+ transport system membrane component KefB
MTTFQSLVVLVALLFAWIAFCISAELPGYVEIAGGFVCGVLAASLRR